MRQRLRHLARRLRDRRRRRVDAGRLNSFGFPVPHGRTLVLLGTEGARKHLPAELAGAPSGEGVGPIVVHDLTDAAALPLDVGHGWASVVLVLGDRSDLRRVIPAVPGLGKVEQVAVWLFRSRAPLGFVARPELPPLVELATHLLGAGDGAGNGVVTRVRFAERVRVRRVLESFAVTATTARERDLAGFHTGYFQTFPEPGLDLGAIAFVKPDDTVAFEFNAPRDVLVSGEPVHLDAPHHVTGRAPVVVNVPDVGPVDEAVFNPIRWVKHPTRGTASLKDVLKRQGGIGEAAVNAVRDRRSVMVDLATANPQDVLRLAMAGIPLEVAGLDAGLRRGFAPTLVDVWRRPVELDDALARAEYALAQRRATFDAHSVLAHRSARAHAAGIDRVRAATHGLPAVSILLATRRAHELDNAVANVAKQVGAEIELVIAAHGFTPDEVAVREKLGSVHGLTVLAFDADTRFGDVLTAAAQTASNPVVMKMDDDDWYSPHAVHDLLMARRFTGADIVGMPTEFVHLAPLNETVWRNEISERFDAHVAGGTMTLSRDLLREVGWFRPVHRWVDAQLLAAVAATGGTTYRTHGLGYVLVRQAEGHTWDQDLEEFKRPDLVEQVFAGLRLPGGEQ